MIARLVLGLACLVAASRAAVVKVYSNSACTTQTTVITAYAGYCFGGLAFKDTFADPSSGAGWAKVAVFYGATCTGTSLADAVVSTSTCVALPGVPNTFLKLAPNPIFTTGTAPLVATFYDNAACTFNSNALATGVFETTECVSYAMVSNAIKMQPGAGYTTTITNYYAYDQTCSGSSITSVYANVPNSGASCVPCVPAYQDGYTGAYVGIAPAAVYTAPALPTPTWGGFTLVKTFQTATCPTNPATAPAKYYNANINSCSSSDGITSTMISCIENGILTFPNSAYCTGTFSKSYFPPTTFNTCIPGSGSSPSTAFSLYYSCSSATGLSASSFVAAAQLSGSNPLMGDYSGSTCGAGTITSMSYVGGCSAMGPTASTSYSCTSPTSYSINSFSSSATCTGDSTTQVPPASAVACSANIYNGGYSQYLCGIAASASASPTPSPAGTSASPTPSPGGAAASMPPTLPSGGFSLIKTFSSTSCPTTPASTAGVFEAYTNTCSSSDGVTSGMMSCPEGGYLTFSSSANCQGTFTKLPFGVSGLSVLGSCVAGTGGSNAFVRYCSNGTLSTSTFLAAAKMSGNVIVSGTYSSSTCSTASLMSYSAASGCIPMSTTGSTLYTCSSSTALSYSTYASVDCSGTAASTQNVPASALTCSSSGSGSGSSSGSLQSYSQMQCVTPPVAKSGALSAAVAGLAVLLTAAAAVMNVL